jgi:hypothetical protein
LQYAVDHETNHGDIIALFEKILAGAETVKLQKLTTNGLDFLRCQ